MSALIYRKGTRVKTSINFFLSEFQCKCNSCDFVMLQVELLMAIQSARSELGKPIIINSGYRCKQHNKEIGGVENSNHIFGDAVDVALPEVGKDELIAILKKHFKYVKIYEGKNFVHCDNRYNIKNKGKL